MITVLANYEFMKGHKMTAKWFIKTHEGEELGPFDYSTLLDMLSSPPYSENATLIRPEWRVAWKPALIEIPSLMDIGEQEQAEAVVSAIAAEIESTPRSTQYLHIHRSRWALLPLAIISLIGMTALLLKLLEVPSGYIAAEPLYGSKRAIFCTVTFVVPLVALWKLAFASFQDHLSEDQYIELFLNHMRRFCFTLLLAVVITIGAYLTSSFS